jgi:carboxyl-terminal processing protease
MPRRIRTLVLLTLVLLALGLGVVGGVLLDRRVLIAFVPPSNIPADAVDSFQLMAEAWNVIQEVYVDRPAIQARRLTYGALTGMVDALGDTGHSRFLSPERVEANRTFAQGQFEGIGAYVEMKDGHIVIAAPMDGSPSQQAGLRAGDVILKVDGENVASLPLDEVVRRIMGPEGTSVTLTILSHDTGQARDVTLVRARITLHNVVWQQLPGTTAAHVRLVAFSHGVTEDLQKTLQEIQQQGLTQVILDLRNNPGGLLDEAIGTTSQFLGSGNVLLEKDAQGQVKPVPVREGGVALEMPLAVLINQGTASAAEIVAGAFQDAGRAKLVGETTFGTGTVLGEFGLSDGSAMLLAVQEWLTPEGRVIWHQGIVPDEVIVLPATARALHPETEADLTPDQLQASEDVQLLRALDLLSASPSTTPGETSKTVMLADNGQTITLQVGERFLLALGEGYDWEITVSDEGILSRVINVTVVRGAQGLYEAHRAGNTTLTAAGDPVCRKSQPPCAMPSMMFEIELVVE